MSLLEGKKILLGITGGIAAYKCPDLVRSLTQSGAIVRVVLTQCAEKFVTAEILNVLSGQQVHSARSEGEEPMSHIRLSRWADIILVVPATANFIAKLSCGFSDDLLSTICLASAAPIAIAPSMNQQMFLNAITQANLQKLSKVNTMIWGPDEGIQACGETGPGRLVEPAVLVEQLNRYFSPKILLNTKVLITAGPTREPLDPVRYVSNYSSGKMGYALAEAALAAGAEVTLVSGPTNLTPSSCINTIAVNSADDMYEAVLDRISGSTIFISAAAVSDYRPDTIATNKIKKNTDVLTVSLTKNKDILAAVGCRSDKPFTVGFAAETDNLLDNAYKKLIEKNCDIIIANLVGEGVGFNADDNHVSVVTHNKTRHLEKASKKHLAAQLIRLIYEDFSSLLLEKAAIPL